MKYHLQGSAKKHTANVFSLNRAAVRKRALRYILHEEGSIGRRSDITIYPLDFQSDVIRMIINLRVCPQKRHGRLNLPTDSIHTRQPPDTAGKSRLKAVAGRQKIFRRPASACSAALTVWGKLKGGKSVKKPSRPRYNHNGIKLKLKGLGLCNTRFRPWGLIG
ncbi:hypothetical protein [Neisseria sp. 19428wB4_WF04]|nr:hypothetical protein [Neisseria sp. 19428wB4_WF04]MBF0804731.1 hypothetical protein [Neisseria sp. 19428wB4_WF04]TFU40254.1 hypothetical protein E4T99_10390 [Neisseria sp. WF04]